MHRRSLQEKKQKYKRGQSPFAKYLPQVVLNHLPENFNPITYKDIYSIIQARYKQDGQDIVNMIENNQHFNRALGSLYGSFIGDALGSYCQFSPKQQMSQNTVNQAMQMKAGGYWNLDAGQLTDDSELALQLGYALLTFQKKKKLIQQIDAITRQISKNYVKWYQSEPFDIGKTTQNALNKFKSINKILKDQQYVDQIIKITQTQNKQSQSNGSLMRIVPMAIFMSLFKSDSKYELAVKQARMTHSKDVVLQSSLEWIKLLESFILNQKNQKICLDQFKLRCKRHNKLKIWISQMENKKIDNSPYQGWVKKIWIYSISRIQYLFKTNHQNWDQQLYIKEIKNVIRFGYDTDTNACILGGLLGALIGFRNLPFKYLKIMLTLKFDKKSRMNRPERYQPYNGIGIIYELFKKNKLKNLEYVSGKI